MTQKNGIWERQKGESESAFARFQAYLELPKPRSSQELAERLGIAVDAVYHTSSRYRWPERTVAYDQYVDREALKVIIQERASIVREHLRAAKGLRQLGARELAARIARSRELAANEGLLSDREWLAALRDGMAMERELLELAEKLVGNEGHDGELDYSRLTEEEQLRLRELLVKAGAT